MYVASSAGVLDLGAGVHLMISAPLLGPFILPTDASGAASLPVPMPTASSLKGTSVYLQVGGTDSKGFTVSNGVEVRICN